MMALCASYCDIIYVSIVRIIESLRERNSLIAVPFSFAAKNEMNYTFLLRKVHFIIKKCVFLTKNGMKLTKIVILLKKGGHIAASYHYVYMLLFFMNEKNHHIKHVDMDNHYFLVLICYLILTVP